MAARLAELLGTPVAFATDTSGRVGAATVAGAADGEVALLENVRFEPAETSKDDAERGAFADRAGRARRRSTSATASASSTASTPASTTSPQRLPARRRAAWSRSEVEVLRRLTADPARPYVVVLGGSKVSDKLGVIDNLLASADRLLIGGGMVYTFLAAQGHGVGTSLLEADQIDTVPRATSPRPTDSAASRSCCPTDIVVADRFARRRRPHEVVAADAIPADRMGLDIGPEPGRPFAAALADARTVFWNGPMGVFESARSPRAPGRSPRR